MGVWGSGSLLGVGRAFLGGYEVGCMGSEGVGRVWVQRKGWGLGSEALDRREFEAAWGEISKGGALGAVWTGDDHIKSAYRRNRNAQVYLGLTRGLRRVVAGLRACGAYVLNSYSRMLGTQPHESEYRIPPGEPCCRQEHVPIQGYWIHKTG